MSEFEYTYSAPEQEEIRKIREKYLPKEETAMDRLRRLDESVTKKGSVLSLTLGILSCLIFGTGMSCCLVWAEAWFLPGIVIGVVGLTGMAGAYPLYVSVTAKERRRIAPEVLRLTEELMK